MKRYTILGSEGVLALLIFALGIAVMWESLRLGFGALAQPGPGLFPLFSGGMICLGAVGVAASAPRRPVSAPILGPGGGRTLVALIAIFAGWILVMPLVGFVIGTFVCVLAFAKVLELEGWVRPSLLALATSIGVYVLFDRLLSLDLPPGLWG